MSSAGGRSEPSPNSTPARDQPGRLICNPGTSVKSSTLSVQRTAPQVMAHEATARSISRPRGRGTEPYSLAVREASSGPKCTDAALGNRASWADN